MSTYGQFCPVAKASEIFAERWTPLILRELLCGSHRFNELERGLPRISRSLLTQRLRSLEAAGLVDRRPNQHGHGSEYHLTTAGEELFDVIVRLGEWSHRWFDPLLDPDNLDPQLLLWDIHRRLNLETLPDHQVVVQFDFRGDRDARHWLVLEPGAPSICWDHPGFEVDLYVNSDTVALHRVWLGHRTFATAIRDGDIELFGEPALARAFPTWFALSMFAGVEPAFATASRASSQPTLAGAQTMA